MPKKKWIVELDDSERDELLAMINKSKAAAWNNLIGERSHHINRLRKMGCKRSTNSRSGMIWYM